MSLTDVTCRATKPGLRRHKLSDGNGLQLWIMPSGARLWRLVYRYLGNQKVWAIGTYPEVSLAEARVQRDGARHLLRQGKDPGAERERLLRAEQERLHVQDSFDKVSREFLDKCQRQGYSTVTLEKKAWLLDVARPRLGNIPVGELKPLDILEVLQAIECRGHYETARRLWNSGLCPFCAMAWLIRSTAMVGRPV